MRGLGEGIEGLSSGFLTGMMLTGRAGNYESVEDARKARELATLSNMTPNEQLDYIKMRLASGAPMDDSLISQLGTSINRVSNNNRLIDQFALERGAATDPMGQERALQNFAIGSARMGNVDPKSMMTTLEQSQGRMLEAEKFNEQQSTKNALRKEYDDVLTEFESVSQKKSLLNAWIDGKQKQLKVKFNEETVKALKGLGPEDHNALMVYLRANPNVGPEQIIQLLTDPDTTNAVQMIGTIINSAPVPEEESTASSRPQMEAHPADELSRQIDMVRDEERRALRLLRIDPSNVEARQTISATRKRMQELTGQSAAYEEAFPRGAAPEKSEYDAEFDPHGRKWNPQAKRVMGLVNQLKQAEAAYARLMVSRNPYAKQEMERLKQGIDQMRNGINSIIGTEKISDNEKRVLADMPAIASKFNPEDPVHRAQMMNNPTIMNQIRSRAVELEQREAVEKTKKTTTATEEIQSEYKTDERSMIARSKTGKPIGPKTSQQDASAILEEEQRRAIEKAEKQAGIDKPLTAGEAGRLSLVMNGFEAAQQVKKDLIRKDGKVDRNLLTQMALNVPGTKGRSIRRSMMEALWAEVRPETGASMNKDEEQGLWDRYGPSQLDNDQTVTEKLNYVEKVLGRTIVLMDPKGVHREAANRQLPGMIGAGQEARDAVEKAKKSLMGK